MAIKMTFWNGQARRFHQSIYNFFSLCASLSSDVFRCQICIFFLFWNCDSDTEGWFYTQIRNCFFDFLGFLLKLQRVKFLVLFQGLRYFFFFFGAYSSQGVGNGPHIYVFRTRVHCSLSIPISTPVTSLWH